MFQLILSADSSIGRFDKNSLSDQTLMELLVDRLTHQAKYILRDSTEEFKDKCTWECVTCDVEDNVVQIHFMQPYNGTLDFAFIPPKVRSFATKNQYFHGTIDTALLPSGLES